VNAAFPVERPSCGAVTETLVEPGRDVAPVGVPTALGTKVRVVLEEKKSGPFVFVTTAGNVHVHAPDSEIVDSAMLEARLAVRPGHILTPEIGYEAPRSTCHQFVPEGQVADETSAGCATKAFVMERSIATIGPLAAVRLAQLLVAIATPVVMSEEPSAPKTSNSAMLSWPEKVDGVVKRMT
jgi:hypothetical protein